MKKRLMMGAALALSALAMAQDVKGSLGRSYGELNGLILKKDVAGMKKLFGSIAHKDFVYVHKDGRKQSGPEMLNEMTSQLGMVTKVNRSTTKINKVEVKGSTAVATVTSAYAMTMVGPDKKSHRIAGQTLTHDTWTKTASGWKLKMVKTVKETATFDGKPMPGFE